MTLVEFQAEFEAARKFVRLHGWVVQSEERLASLRHALAASDDAESLLSSVLKSFQSASTTQEKLFALCLLRDTHLSADHLAGFLFEHLQGEFTSTDGQFFLRQFFRHGPPVPLEVSRQITDRVYLTYQRAILQAMKIQQFESSYDAQQIVLFLTHLLCRIELNEQNRAILYLLLSRIDAPLPESLNQAVGRAMNNLQEIIRDVQLRQDKVLSEEHPAAPATSGEDPWAPRHQVVRERSEAPVASAATVPPKPLFEFSRSRANSPGKRQSPTDAVPEPDSRKAGGIPLWDELSPLSKSSGASPVAPSPRVPSSKKSRLFEKFLPQTARVETANPKRPFLWGKTAADSESQRTWAEPPDRVISTSSEPPMPDGGRKSFVIRFNQEKSELSSLLELLATGPEIQQPVDATQDKKPSLGKELWKRRWWAGGLVVALAAIFLVAGVLGPTERAAPKALPTLTEPAAQTAEVHSPPDLDIRSQPEGKYWYPRQGESLWKLYRQLRTQPGGPGPWTEFQKRILSLNPAVAEADLIFPAKPLKFDP